VYDRHRQPRRNPKIERTTLALGWKTRVVESEQETFLGVMKQTRQ
jgi:hypothetical protein